MPPKIGFMNDQGLMNPIKSVTPSKFLPWGSIQIKDPGMNAEELNLLPSPAVETSTESISSPFLVTRSKLSNHHDSSLLLSPFLVKQNVKDPTVSTIC